MNILIMIEFKSSYMSTWFFFIVFIFSFLIGLVLKIGITPFHLFKIEVYRGIPFLSIFFYTTFYFLNYFIFFIVLFTSYLSSLVGFY